MEDLFCDNYFINVFHRTIENRYSIGYVHTNIESADDTFLLLCGIAFVVFETMIWIIKHLSEQLQIFQNELLDIGSKERVTSELKLFRIFCLQFMNESKPIVIRLTRIYMECLEEHWEQFRLPDLIAHVNNQLVALDEMFSWRESAKKELRETQIGLAAVLLALISIAAVVAQLISTIDVNSQLSVLERAQLVLLGLLIGTLSTLVIYFVPLIRWRRGSVLSGKGHRKLR